MEKREDNLYNINYFENINNKEQKQKLAMKIAEKVKDGDIIGVGSGSTSYLALCEIAKKVNENNMKIIAIPTSYEIKMVCANLGIPTASLLEKTPNWSFDGADEVDNNDWIIKGRGAALFKEKLNIKNSKEVFILIDETKCVNKLCEKFPVPVECYPDSINYVQEQLLKLGAKNIKLRQAVGKDGPIITENGNFILDVVFENINENLEKELKNIVGVIETGLFIGYENIQILK